MWVMASFVLLFLTIVILLKIPFIQTKTANYVVSFLTDKTHTKITLKEIDISFPKSLVLRGLYVEDINKDTLLFTGYAKVDIAFNRLLNHSIKINEFSLQNTYLRLNRKETDSLFNYHFLLAVFSDTSSSRQNTPEKESKWTISVNGVDMKNVRFQYEDNFGGTFMSVNLQNLKLKMNNISLQSSMYNIDELLIDNSTAEFFQKKGKEIKNHLSNKVYPEITANKIELKNIHFTFGDSINNQSISSHIYELELKGPSFNMHTQMISLNKIALSNSEIRYNRTNQSSQVLLDSASSDQNKKGNWVINVKKISLKDNSLAYMVTNRAEIKNSFDPYHLDLRHFFLKADDFNYSTERTQVLIRELSSLDKNNFAITSFETEFVMDPHSISARKLKAKTHNSFIEANLKISYSSLYSLADSVQFMQIETDLKKAIAKNSEIIYFAPQLLKQPFFTDISNTSTITGRITGPLNNLNGKNLIIRTGKSTVVKTDFNVKGLPAINLSVFDAPDLTITSGKQDIIEFAGKYLPENIEVPENFSLLISFKGQIRSFESKLVLKSTIGSGTFFANIDKEKHFAGNAILSDFNLGSLLRKSSLLGPVSLTAETKGQILAGDSIVGEINADISQAFINNYNYHKLNIKGSIDRRKFEGKINLNDENAVFAFDGILDLNPKQEQYKFNFILEGADLQKLNLTTDDIKIALVASSDLEGSSASKINGKAGITKILIAHQGKKYTLDSLLIASINEPGKSELTVSSALIDINYKGTFSPVDLPVEMRKFINNYFPFSDTTRLKKSTVPQNFNFDIQLHNHPILSDALFPSLKEFEPGTIQGSFDSQKNKLNLNVSLKKIAYGTIAIKDASFIVNSDDSDLIYQLSLMNMSTPQLQLSNLTIDGKLTNNIISNTISSIDENQNRKLQLQFHIIKDGLYNKMIVEPDNFYLMNDKWEVAKDNYIKFYKGEFLFHNIFLNKNTSQINITSVHDNFNDDITIKTKNLKLEDFSGIIQKDTLLVKGVVNGNILFKRVNNSYGIVSETKISDLSVYDIPVGNLSINADNPSGDRFNLDVNLSGMGNNMNIQGYFIPEKNHSYLNLTSEINSLNVKTIEAFSMGEIKESAGTLHGNFLIAGESDSPEINGDLIFNNVTTKPAWLNNKLELKNETIKFKKDMIYFNSFTILDTNQHTAIVNGNIRNAHFKDLIFNLNVNTWDFLLFNSTAKVNKEFYGKMIVDSKIDISGALTLPVINGKIKMKKGSNFTFAVPEKKLSRDKGENVVEFNDSLKLNPILSRNEKKEQQKSALKGIDISSIIEIDKEATLRLLLDPTSEDSLVVRGQGALSFTMDRSGKMSLTGAYDLHDGSYLVSLESILKRKFDIESGSTIMWNGDPLEAEVAINAIYSVRAAPIDLVANQTYGLSESDQASFKQRYPFRILLKLRGQILHPEITFEIQLSPENKAILNGALNERLTMLNEDPSALNKQVFALLVLGRFIQEDPLQTETNSNSAIVRTTVGKFLSAQLNQMGAKLVPGVELNFDVQSYDEYQTGHAEGRTQVDVGLKKELFNQRLSVQVGGTVDVEGEKAKQNSASDITSDVALEYKMTKDGRFRLKGFRHNQYEGAIEGPLVETGAGVLFVRDFNKWKELFHKAKNVVDQTEKAISKDAPKNK